ncbi:cytochrome c oxidase assembly protein COX16 homolog l(3)neo43 isoform X2 [Calliopsis andreniformis]|uniref:cytochrome c oxidase assembly protein COX16 homolog l(3)neo43 isoform X2 n=1 Tax=Calliopsis andreniformis TaxID=337506 RepID=UPI003FCE35A5
MHTFFQSKIFRHFVPFMILVVGGSFYVREFAEVRKVKSYDDIKHQIGADDIKMNKPATLEEEYEKIKKLDIDNWQNVRISRPWEEKDESS